MEVANEYLDVGVLMFAIGGFFFKKKRGSGRWVDWDFIHNYT